MNTSEPKSKVWCRFQLWHLLVLVTFVCVFAWWTTVAGIERCRVRLVDFQLHLALDDATPEATVLIHVESPEGYHVGGESEVLVIDAFINLAATNDDLSHRVGEEFEFKYQKHAAFGRPAETLGTAVMRAIDPGGFEVHSERFR